MASSLGIAPESVRPLLRSEYEHLVASGAFEGERVELLYGVVVRMSPHGTRHDGVVQRLNRLLLLALDPRAAVRIQSAFAASNGSQPEPDVAVVAPGDYLTAHPATAQLIVEVADSSLPIDHGLKAKLYAESGVEEYWVVNLVDGLIEVHTEIVGGTYVRMTPVRRGDGVRLRSFPDVELRADDILP